MTEQQLQLALRLKAHEHPADMAAYAEDIVHGVHAKLLQDRLQESTFSILRERLAFWWQSLTSRQLALATVSALAVMALLVGAWPQSSGPQITGLTLGHDDLVLPAKAMTSPSLGLGMFEEQGGLSGSPSLLSKHFSGGFSDDAWRSAIGETITVRKGAPFEAIPDIQFGFDDEGAESKELTEKPADSK